MLGVGAWRKELVPTEHIFSFRFRSYFGEPLLSMEANRATLELLPCRKVAEEHGGVSVHFEWITHTLTRMHAHTHTRILSVQERCFFSRSNGDLLLKRGICSWAPGSKFLFLGFGLVQGVPYLSREANGKSQKLHPFEHWAEVCGGVSIHLS